MEDAVKEIFSLKHQLIAKAADTCLGLEKEESEFKPVSEMTLEDWELAKDEGWVFETTCGVEDTVIIIDSSCDQYPVEFRKSGWKTLDGFDTYYRERRDGDDINISKRIR